MRGQTLSDPYYLFSVFETQTNLQAPWPIEITDL